MPGSSSIMPTRMSLAGDVGWGAIHVDDFAGGAE